MPSRLLWALLSLILAAISIAASFNLSTLRAIFSRSLTTATSTMLNTNSIDSQWKKALENLPGSPEHIPSFFFAHGSPALAHDMGGRFPKGVSDYMGPKGVNARFLADFGPALLKKYKPKAILVFSAHWETDGERLVTDYGDENPLLYDYYGFPKALYELKFKSRGDSALTKRVVELFKESGMKARATTKVEPRGEDGRGFAGPGFDHGVFVPFRIMFGEECELPVVQASIDGDLSPESNWKIGQAVKKLRDEGVLVLSGGLTYHNLRNFAAFDPQSAPQVLREFDSAIFDAVRETSPTERRKAMARLVSHPGFRAAHPREDHFVPLYVAGGAGDGEDAAPLLQAYGIASFVFGS